MSKSKPIELLVVHAGSVLHLQSRIRDAAVNMQNFVRLA
jgi:hypothetical protein